MITDMKDAKIFSPLQLGRTTLKNRIAMAPMSMHYEATNGTVPKQLADIFVRRAEGGAGYVVIDAVTVDHKYWYIGKTTALDKDSLVPQFAAFAKRVSDAGSTLFPQLIHPGPESICALKGITPLGPSVNTNANGAVSRPITIDEIHKVVKQYGQAARRAEEAGCGGIALHVAHAYMLPGAFLSPLRNKRMDEYGGCIDNRARLILEIIEECRRNISPDFPIVLRVSGSEREPGGNSLDEMLYLAPKFEAAGVDMLEVSGGVQYEGLQNILPSHSQKIGMNVYEASEIKKVVNIPVFVVGKINDVRYAADLVERGLVDGVSMGRPLLADPDLPKKAYENRFDDITPCGSCGGRCITPEDPHHPVCKCHINPLVGHEYDYPFNPTDKPKKVLVIGAGPGGMYTAVTAAERGHDVTVWEKSKQIGGQLNLAVGSPGKQEMCKWLTHLNYRAKKAGVKFEFKKEATVESVKEFAPDAVVVATGATLADCEANYRQMLLKNNLISDDQGSIDVTPSDYKSVEGTIAEIRTAVVDGNSIYFLRFDGESAFSVRMSAAEVAYAPLLNVGDRVCVYYRDGYVTENWIEASDVELLDGSAQSAPPVETSVSTEDSADPFENAQEMP